MKMRGWINDNIKIIDWDDIYSKWIKMQKYHNPWRDEQIKTVVKAIKALPFKQIKVIDLCCGPGTLSEALLKAEKKVKIIGIDADIFLLSIFKNHLNKYSKRFKLIEADVRKLKINEKVHGVVSLTALHWLSKGSHIKLYKKIYKKLEKGGVFINADRFKPEHRIKFKTKQRGDNWTTFWDKLHKEHGIKDKMEEMWKEMGLFEGTDDGYPVNFFRDAIKKAGFKDFRILFKTGDRIVYIGRK